MSAEHKKRLTYLKGKGKLIDAEKKELALLEKYLGKKEAPAPAPKAEVKAESEPKEKVADKPEPKKEEKKK